MLTVEEKPIVSTARKNLPVCVLDDEADLVDLATDRLTKLGFPTVGTTDPQEALQKIRLGGCRAVIADFRMPAMDGLAFLEKVLQYDPGIYVILVTGYYSVDAAIDAIKRGAYDYLAKSRFRALDESTRRPR
ncbi:MAG: response regulator [Candidatus Acidiferrales bacterium]